MIRFVAFVLVGAAAAFVSWLVLTASGEREERNGLATRVRPDIPREGTVLATAGDFVDARAGDAGRGIGVRDRTGR